MHEEPDQSEPKATNPMGTGLGPCGEKVAHPGEDQLTEGTVSDWMAEDGYES
ncbi:MAG: hypothetical protein HWE21_06380 [Cytophagia bacterium]|nr:hypothetical protein [Cytophagia bacterium]